MSRIEMVMLLQSVDLFRSCAATEAVRLAQIAELVEFEAGQVIYRPTEPSRALYCIVEGRVSVEGRGGYRRDCGPRSAFGVLEILSGRQRGSRAEAMEATTVLSIEGEDFFDLLSNNIDIVKALFRELLSTPERAVLKGEQQRSVPVDSEPVSDGSGFVASPSPLGGVGSERDLGMAHGDREVNDGTPR